MTVRKNGITILCNCPAYSKCTGPATFHGKNMKQINKELKRRGWVRKKAKYGKRLEHYSPACVCYGVHLEDYD